MSIKKAVFKGIRWKLVTMVLIAVLNLLQIYILVRFIEKRDFGLMAIVNVVIFFAQTFLDLGVNNGIIHKEKTTSRQLSSLYWLSVIVGFCLSAFVFLLSDGIATFYQEPEISTLLQIMAISFIINGFGSQFKVLLLKELKFDQLAKVELISMIFSFSITVGLAVNGYGVLALVMGFLVRALSETILSAFFGRRIHSPNLIFNIQEIFFFLKFGSFQLGETLLNFFSKQIDTLVIGKILGPDILGVYDIIKKFLLRPMSYINPILTTVLFPAMSKIQNDQKALMETYLKQLNYLCLFNFPIYLFLFFFSEEIIFLMFGPSWVAYDLLFKLFTIYYLLYSIGNPIGTLLLAKGRADLGFYWSGLVFVFFTVTILIYVPWGIDYVAIALVALQVLFILPLYFLIVKKLIPVSLSRYISTFLIPLGLALVINLAGYFLSLYLVESLILKLILGITINGGLFLLFNQLFNAQFISDLKLMVKVNNN